MSLIKFFHFEKIVNVAIKDIKTLTAWLMQIDWILITASFNKCDDEMIDAIKSSEGSQIINNPQL